MAARGVPGGVRVRPDRVRGGRRRPAGARGPWHGRHQDRTFRALRRQAMSDYMDGNMLGGTLGELFSMDVTSAVATCVSCGASWAIAQTRVYPHAPGMVARCPACDAVLLRLGRDHPRALGVVRADPPAEGLPVEALERSRARPARLEPADRIRHRPPLPRHGPSRRGPGARAPQYPARRPSFCQRLIAWAACGGPVTARGCEMTTPEGAARTVIVTVDDDPGVSRAVARDLRRRYGEQHRIVRAESGDAALDALREMKLRGDEVAVIVADYRMPGMNGIEFLERAMDFYPT